MASIDTGELEILLPGFQRILKEAAEIKYLFSIGIIKKLELVLQLKIHKKSLNFFY